MKEQGTPDAASNSWGKLLSVTGTLAATLGADQPFRYRGYVYDTETGWYYLQSRYYDPETCRFISADVLLSTGQGVIGHNSFAYCLNRPNNGADSEGKRFRPNNVMMTDNGGGFEYYNVDAARLRLKNYEQEKHNRKSKNHSRNKLFGACLRKIIGSKVPASIDMLSPIKVENGVNTSIVLSESGCSTKPISVFVEINEADFVSSSIGMSLNFQNSTVEMNLGIGESSILLYYTDNNNASCYLGIVNTNTSLYPSIEFGSGTSGIYDYTNYSSNPFFLAYAFAIAYGIATGQPYPDAIFQPAS